MDLIRNFISVVILMTGAIDPIQADIFYAVPWAPQKNQNLTYTQPYFTAQPRTDKTRKDIQYSLKGITNKSDATQFRQESNKRLIEPSTLLLMALGLIGLGLAIRIK